MILTFKAMGRKNKENKKNNHRLSGAGSLRWDFPSTNHGEEKGFSDPGIEFFEGDYNRSIARETIQNSIDARSDYDKPVRVVYERFTMPMKDLPGNSMLLGKMIRCLKFAEGQDQKATNFFKNAIDLLGEEKLPILKISDFNTVGLSGSDDDRSGHWYRLVRVVGTSSPKGAGGGSFGIGKGAPFAGSLIRTVFYSSVNSSKQPVFQGVARLSSHYDEENDVRQGVGFYGIEGYKAIRESKIIPDLFERKDLGTDIFIMGHKSDEDWRAKLIRSVLHNFWLAILCGDLEVVIKNGDEVMISKENLKEVLEKWEAEDAGYFFEAVTNSTQKFVSPELKHLGQVSLYVRKQDDYPGKIMMVRKPKMLVQEKQYRVLREPYAGVAICDDERGDRLLRELEPPAHDKWDRERKTPEGQIALRELDDFIKQSLKSMGEAITSEPQDIPGLDRYLPDSEDRDYISGAEGAIPQDSTELLSGEESGRETGALKESTVAEVEAILRRAALVKIPGKGNGEGPGRGGLNKSGGGDQAGLSGGQEEGEGAGERIRTSDIGFRSFMQKSKDGLEYRLIITGLEDCKGAIRMVAIGDDVSYSADVETARDIDSKKSYEVAGSMIKGLSVEKGQTVRLSVRLAEHNKKYALGIEKYEG
ncbi:MAG: hypothetical protein Q8Q86_02080 [Candidatus Daviesbacteria bacterium]|nr:hypothetical protein [Candidatus Daviesbacteria bacterium]